MFSKLVPGPLVRFFARPYVAGDSIQAALDVADEIRRDKQLLTTFDLLGEDVDTEKKVAANVEVYEQLIQRVADDSRLRVGEYQPTVSLKPSGFTAKDQDDVRERLAHLVRFAHERQVGVTIDMEDRDWTDITIDVATALFREGLDVGTVLQTRLHRTEADLEKIPEGMRVRIVIGIYPEPPDVAITDKNEMKERLLTYAKVLLHQGCFVEFGTHDEAFIERFAREVAPAAPDRCEVQMLLGVPRDEVIGKLTSGDFGVTLPVRLYVPFAVGWSDATAYLRRRMDESPSMIWLVLRNIAARRRENAQSK